MNINKIVPLETNNQRVLTTERIADVYGTIPQIVINNFNRNKERYQEGVHYNLLKGEELCEFRAINQIDLLGKNVRKLYLWTEKGALLHAKSLNTDKAWEVYMYLVDFYFREKEKQLAELHVKVVETCKLQTKQILQLSKENSILKHTSVVPAGGQDALKMTARRNILILLGGKETVSYKLYAMRAYKALWRDYRRHFRLDSYRNTPEYRFEEGIDFLSSWEPDKWLRKAIKIVEREFYSYLETFFDDFYNDGYKKLIADCPAIIDDFIHMLAKAD